MGLAQAAAVLHALRRAAVEPDPSGLIEPEVDGSTLSVLGRQVADLWQRNYDFDLGGTRRSTVPEAQADSIQNAASLAVFALRPVILQKHPRTTRDLLVQLGSVYPMVEAWNIDPLEPDERAECALVIRSLASAIGFLIRETGVPRDWIGEICPEEIDGYLQRAGYASKREGTLTTCTKRG